MVMSACILTVSKVPVTEKLQAKIEQLKKEGKVIINVHHTIAFNKGDILCHSFLITYDKPELKEK